MATLKVAAEKIQAADQAGVNLAKATFMSKLLGIGMAAVTVGVAAAFAGVTFGAGAALLAVASVRLALLVGDAACAYRAMKDAQAVPPRNSLPLKANALGNALHGVFTRLGMKPEKATRHATSVSAVTAVGLAVVGLGLGQAVAVSDVVGKGLQVAASGMLGLMWARDSHVNRQTDHAARDARRAKRSVIAAVNRLPSSEIKRALTRLQEALPHSLELRPLQEDLQGLASQNPQNPVRVYDMEPVRNRLVGNAGRHVAASTSPMGLAISLARFLVAQATQAP